MFSKADGGSFIIPSDNFDIASTWWENIASQGQEPNLVIRPDKSVVRVKSPELDLVVNHSVQEIWSWVCT